MNVSSAIKLKAPLHFEKHILEQGDQISKKLHLLSLQRFPPNAKKGLRSFSLAEVATFLGVSQSHLKKLHLEGKGPTPETSSSGGAPTQQSRCWSSGSILINTVDQTRACTFRIDDLARSCRYLRS